MEVLILRIRLWEESEGYAALAAINSQTAFEPVTAGSIAEADGRLPAGAFQERLLAVAADGATLGYAVVRRMPFEAPGSFLVKALVDRGSRGRGIGGALVAEAERRAQAAGASRLRTTVRDDDPASRAFAESRGYVLHKHTFESALNVAAFDESPFAGVIERLEGEGIRFLTLADAPGEATERELYELDKVASRDNPGEELPEFLPFEEWRKFAVAGADCRPELLQMAADGERLIGLSDVHPIDGSSALNTGFTGVHPDYRGRGVALALKLMSIRAARRFGAPYVRTQNDSRNGPMLAINRKLGFVPWPGMFTMHKEIR